MSFFKKSFDFSGKMNNNKNFYIFNTTSPNKASEIISKLEKYENTYDFFKHYTNSDLKNAFLLLENLGNIYSHLYSENYKNIFNSKIDSYISSLSNLYLLSNLISKNKLIINKAIDKIKKNLETFYIENTINNNIQKQLNNYIINANGIGIEGKKSKKKVPILLTNNYKALKIENVDSIMLSGRIIKIKNTDCSLNNYSLNQEKTRDITNQTINNINNNSKITEDNNYILDLRTPSFPKKIAESNPSANNINQQMINDSINDNASKKESIRSFCIKDNDDLSKKYFKKESIRSLYTLASKSKFHEEKIRAVSSKFKGIPQEESTSTKNKNIKINSCINIKKNSKFLINIRKNNINTINKSEDKDEIKNEFKKHNLSSTKLKITREKMYKDLLILINNLFKTEIINFEEKIHLKQLIIIKSENFDNIYANYYPNNKETLIAEMKKLIK